ncbi:MAG: hypothetical protein SF162_08865 [bacterium]|nr:hypothetical protein [bacterium]
MPDSIGLTVILVVSLQRARGAHCLKHILSQQVRDPIEVLLFDVQHGQADPLPGSDHPWVRVLPVTPETAHRGYGAIIREALHTARAPVIAAIQEHAFPLAGWAQATIDAHQGNPHAMISGELYNGNAGRGAADVIYAANYLHVMAPRTKGTTAYLIGHNSSYKRDIMLRYSDADADALELLIQNELLLIKRLLADGHTLYADPAIKMAHCHETLHASHRVSTLLYNRSLGAARVSLEGGALRKRVRYTLTAPVGPFVRLVRQLLRAARLHPEKLPVLRANLLHLWIYHALGVYGHLIGLYAGAGDSAARFLYYELNEYRHLDGVDVLPIRTPLNGELP